MTLREDHGMIGLLIVTAGTLLLITAGSKGRRPATQPARPNRKR